MTHLSSKIHDVVLRCSWINQHVQAFQERRDQEIVERSVLHPADFDEFPNHERKISKHDRVGFSQTVAVFEVRLKIAQEKSTQICTVDFLKWVNAASHKHHEFCRPFWIKQARLEQLLEAFPETIQKVN